VHPVPLDSSDVIARGDSIPVPDCTHLQPAFYPDHPYWGEHLRALNRQAWVYHRSFTMPNVPYRRVQLRFDGVDYFADVWVNGRFAGRHEGHFAPFRLNVTDLLNKDSTNMLTVRVSAPWDNPNPNGTYPSDHVIRRLVKGLYEHGEGVIPPDVNPIGIWRPVWLLLDHGVSIDRVRIRTELTGQVEVSVTIANTTADIWNGALDLNIEPENHTGNSAVSSHSLKLSPGIHHIDCSFQVADPRLWWPWDHGSPALYRLAAVLHDGGKQVVSQHEETFGIRTVRLERSPARFTYWINERPVFVRGTSYMPALYLSQCDRSSLARDIALARDANLNLLRVHVHVAPPDLYDLCDRAGMLIWQDFELNWIHDSSPEFEARARVLQRDMMALLGNHPSIITWSCHNEPTMVFTRRQNLEQHPDPALYADAIQQDPTRPVFLCSGQMEADWQRSGDTHSYYGAIWTKRYSDVYRHRFRLNTEFGFETPAAATTLRQYPDVWERLRHLADQIDDLWAYQAALIQFHVEHFRRLRAKCCGGYIHFWLTDLVPQVGCGVLDSKRQPKGGYDALRQASQPLQIALEHDSRRPKALWIFNDTLDEYPDALVRWRVRGADGSLLIEDEVRFNVRGNTSQLVTPARWGVPPKRCARIELTLLSGEGNVLAENVYLHPYQPLRRPRGYPWKFDPYLGTKVFDRPDAPSLADYNVHGIVKMIPVIVREAIAEWALRQRLPHWLVSRIARVIDRILS